MKTKDIKKTLLITIFVFIALILAFGNHPSHAYEPFHQDPTKKDTSTAQQVHNMGLEPFTYYSIEGNKMNAYGYVKYKNKKPVNNSISIWKLSGLSWDEFASDKYEDWLASRNDNGDTNALSMHAYQIYVKRPYDNQWWYFDDGYLMIGVKGDKNKYATTDGFKNVFCAEQDTNGGKFNYVLTHIIEINLDGDNVVKIKDKNHKGDNAVKVTGKSSNLFMRKLAYVLNTVGNEEKYATNEITVKMIENAQNYFWLYAGELKNIINSCGMTSTLKKSPKPSNGGFTNDILNEGIKKSNIAAKIYIFETGSGQSRIVFKTNNGQDDGEVELNLKKVDSGDNPVKSVSFVITKMDNIDKIKNNDKELKVEDAITISNKKQKENVTANIQLIPQNKTKKMVLTLQEQTKDKTFSPLKKPFDLEIKYNNGKITEITPSKYKKYLNFDGENGTLTIKNDSILNYLVIGKNIPGAIFDVTLKNVRQVQINKTFFAEPDKTPENVATTNGDYYVFKGEGDNPTIQIKGLVTKYTKLKNESEKIPAIKLVGLVHTEKDIDVTLHEVKIDYDILKAQDKKGKFSGKTFNVLPDINFTVTRGKDGYTCNNENLYKSDINKVIFKFVDEEKGDNPSLKIQLKKVNGSGTELNGAVFTIKQGKNAGKINGHNGAATITVNGTSDIIEITPKDVSQKYVNLTIHEDSAPTSGSFKPLKDSFSVKVKYKQKGDTLEVTKVDIIKKDPEDADKIAGSYNSGIGLITVTNDDGGGDEPDYPRFTIKKVSKSDSHDPIENVKFTFTFTDVRSVTVNGSTKTNAFGDDITVSNIKTDEDGEIKVTNIMPAYEPSSEEDESEPKVELEEMFVTIHETDATDDYKLLDEDLDIKFVKGSSGWSMQKDSKNKLDDEYFEIGEDNVTLIIMNEENNKLDELNFEKLVQQTGEKTNDPIFDVTISNVTSVNSSSLGSGSYNSGSKTITYRGVSLNNIHLKDVAFSGEDPLSVVITEVDSTEYFKPLQGSIKFTIDKDRDEDTFIVEDDDTDAKIEDREFDFDECVEVNDKTVSITVKNVKLMDLKGNVWLDEQKGTKEVKPADGYMDATEERVGGINVFLYQNGEIVETTKTDASGHYEFLKIEVPDMNAGGTESEGEDDIVPIDEDDEDDEDELVDVQDDESEGPNGYSIVFEYNGINYEDTLKVEGFETLDNTSKAFADPAELEAFRQRFKTIEPDESNDGTPLSYDYDSENKTSTLKTDINGNNPAAPEDDEQSFKMYSKSYTEFYDTTDNINFGMIEKSYDISMSNRVTNVQYTINDVSWSEPLKNEDGSPIDPSEDVPAPKNVAVLTNMYYSDYRYRIENYLDFASGAPSVTKDETTRMDESEAGDVQYTDLSDESLELSAVVTYDVKIQNHRPEERHKLEAATILYTYDAEKYILLDEEGIYDDDNGVIEIKLTGAELETGITLQFMLAKDDNEYLYTGVFETKAEIISYTTKEGGFIDEDSEPKNENLDDDTQGCTIEFKLTTDDRVVNGDVAEGQGNGLIRRDRPINDVIVQLVEFKNGNEFIWQQTRSGSNEVVAIDDFGRFYTYTNSLVEGSADGQYEFCGFSIALSDSETGSGPSLSSGGEFIPGTYFIRFVYGDGYSYDLDLTKASKDRWDYDPSDDVLKYNGQDYKSDIDPNYKVEDMINCSYPEAEINDRSKASDNELRRLKVMAYSVRINNEIGEILNQEHTDEDVFLEKTRMCAETAKMVFEVGKIKQEHINLGLVERPKTHLVLEKHITALKVTPAKEGAQPVVDAKAQLINGGRDVTVAATTTGIDNHLSVIPSARNLRGFWMVQTDVEELMQGADLEVEYTYVIKNLGEEDWLSEELINRYEADINNDKEGENYKAILSNPDPDKTIYLKGSRANYGKLLGQWYYNGIESGCKKVGSSVELLRENVNNDISFVETEGATFGEEELDNPVSYYNTKGEYCEDEKELDKKIETLETTKVIATNTSNTDKVAKFEAQVGAETEGITIPSYIADIIVYTNAAGRRDCWSVPENLSYVHSEDTGISVDSFSYTEDDDSRVHYKDYIRNAEGEIDYTASYSGLSATELDTVEKLNEEDEFWGESIIITKPTGEDKQLVVNIVIVTVSLVAVLGVGIILIKKYAIKK